MFRKIGFIGCGNMGGAVARAVGAGGAAEQILLADQMRDKAESLAQSLKNAAASDNMEIARECDLVFLSVKPQTLAGMLSEIQSVLSARKDRFVLCTMAAGIPCAKIREMAGGDYPVVRIMPNMAVSVGKGVIQFCTVDVTDAETNAFLRALRCAGDLYALPEGLIDAASAISGCGPAFAFLFCEALADGGVACGLPRDKALAFAAGMLEGAAALAKASGQHPAILKDAVCSPAGTTIQGVRTLEERGFRGAVMDAVIASYNRTLELK